MLRIWMSKHNQECENLVYNPPKYFDNAFEPEWLNDDLVKEMVKDVDKSEIISPYCIQSPVLGQIAPSILSGGVKTLILMLKEDSERVWNATVCGDNCAKWIEEIAKHKDLTIRLGHVMEFTDNLEAYIINDGKYIKGFNEYLDEWVD